MPLLDLIEQDRITVRRRRRSHRPVARRDCDSGGLRAGHDFHGALRQLAEDGVDIRVLPPLQGLRQFREFADESAPAIRRHAVRSDRFP